MAGLNKWIGIGNLTADVEMRYTQSGTAKSSFTMACNDRFKDRDGEMKDRVEYVRIVAWGRLAEVCGEYLMKGSQAYIEGRLQTRSWEGKDGKKRYITEVIASTMVMLGNTKKNGSENDNGSRSHENGPNAPDDDIPF